MAQPISLIDINELSRRLSIPKGTLYNWVYLHRITFIKAGRSLRFDARRNFRLVHRRWPQYHGASARDVPAFLLGVQRRGARSAIFRIFGRKRFLPSPALWRR